MEGDMALRSTLLKCNCGLRIGGFSRVGGNLTITLVIKMV
jgi:hypothetical protein